MVTPARLRFGKELDKLEISDIETLIENKIDESQNLEYKGLTENLEKDCNYLAETISGFLNTDGGILIYGVSEKKENNHTYPNDIKWCNTPKERLENLLKHRIQPWEEKIKIHRIKSKENEQDGIFVIEIPRSNNPPHMYNGRYYQRLNYQTQPMTHQNVFRAFQTSWIRRRELYQNVVEPLYSEIKGNCEKIEKYEQGESGIYSSILHKNRYLYDQIELSLQKKIDDFYRRMNDLNLKLSWGERIATRIINEELCKVFDEQRDFIESNMEEDYLRITASVRYPDGRINVVNHAKALSAALFLGTTPKSYLQNCYLHAEVIDYKPILHAERDTEISDEAFWKLWDECSAKAKENDVYVLIRNEIPRLLTLGREILRFMLSK